MNKLKFNMKVFDWCKLLMAMVLVATSGVWAQTVTTVSTVSLKYLPKGLYIVNVKFDSEKQILRIPVR